MSHDDRSKAIKKLAELIGDIPAAMLTTCLPDQSLRSRPMVNVNHNFDGDLWFFTHKNDPKAQEVTANPQVNVAFTSPSDGRYVSVSGTASLVSDKKRAELHWTDACEKWLPQGRSNPDLMLLKVDVERAEYWDEKSNKMASITGALKRAVGGERSASVDHEKIDW